MSNLHIGMRVEALYCYGFKPDQKLEATERRDIVEWTLRFEECTNTREELEAMSDKDLVAAAYGAMADYARGQI